MRPFRASGRSWSLGVALIAVAALAFASPGAPLSAVVPQDHAAEPSIPDVVERVVPAVVSIYSTRISPEHASEMELPFGRGLRPQQPMEQGLGSGVIVAADGVILTNNHVVQSADDIRVVLPDRREFKAKVVGTDPRADLAVLRIPAKDLPTLPFGDSSRMRVGETVLAVGNPLGVGQTVSRGIISGKGRANVGVAEFEDFLQTDAAINPGNSGGALVNLKGELIGINTAIASRTGGFQGIGFAIPSSMAHEIMALLLKNGKVSRGQLGIMIQELTPMIAKSLEKAPAHGVLVSDVVPKSPAEKAGLQRGDIIVKVEGEAVETPGALRNRVALRGSGTEVKLELWRAGRIRTFTVTLRGDSRDESTARSGSEDANAEDARGSATGLPGVRVTPAHPGSLNHHGLPEDLKGLLVTAVDASATMHGLREGDLILEVNRKPVTTVQEMKAAAGDSRDAALLTVRRKEGTIFVAVPKE
jgi:serine protease Do